MKLAILYDVYGWAYHAKARSLKKYLDRNISKYGIKAECFAYPDFYWGPKHKKYQKNIDKVLLFPRQARPMRFPAEKTQVVFFSFGDFSNQKSLNSINFEKIICMNKQIKEDAIKMLHDDLNGNTKNIIDLKVSVDTEHFKRKKISKNKKLVVGFAGNTERKLKGYDIIKEAEKMFGDHAELKVATYLRDGRISYEDMPSFYNSLDLLICISKSEGGPMPCFEAGACGVPTILSCKRSAIWEATKDGYDRFDVERNAKSIADKVIEISKDRNKLDIVSKNIEDTIEKNHSWNSNIDNYAKILLNK